jgi:hypothetical protein
MYDKPPQYLIDAVRRGDWIDPKDPYVRKMMREEKKKEKERKKLLQQQEEIPFELEQRFIDRRIEYLEREHELFEKQQDSIHHTINWNYPLTCKYDHCGCTSMRIVEKPNYIHYAEYVCNLCHRHNAWIPYKDKEKVLSFPQVTEHIVENCVEN